MRTIGLGLIGLMFLQQLVFANNQTPDNSPILTDESLPYRISIKQLPFQLPIGNHSGAIGRFKGLGVIIGGRKNGMHGFTNVGSFPANEQNTTVFVIDFKNQQIYSRDLREQSSGLTQTDIETLSVTDPEYFQDGHTLYFIGGYGYDSNSQTFDTKTTLTAINLPGLINWVINNQGSVKQNTQQLSDPQLQVTGGKAIKIGNIIYLVFGQTFTGEYTSSSNGIYTQQMRRFSISDTFNIQFLPAIPESGSDNYRRRDFNLLPAIYQLGKNLVYGFVQFSGVFTESGGVWTIPVTFQDGGSLTMKNASDPTAFKQGMNVYSSSAISLYSNRNKAMYNIFFGGLTYQYFNNGSLVTDSSIPYTNQIVTIKMDSQGIFTEHLMSTSMPTIPDPAPLGYLFFGTAAYFFANNISAYPNQVLNYDYIRKPTVIGYIVGGIQSTVLNTTDPVTQTNSSRYIFEVSLQPK